MLGGGLIYIKLIFGQSIFYQYEVNKTEFLLYHISQHSIDGQFASSIALTDD
jgi:hypothetical protein